MPTLRPVAVAGMFYPGESASLAAEIAAYLAEGAAGASVGAPPKAIIAPHAGYMYSGPIAGTVYAQLAALRGKVRRVVLVGPAHRVYVSGAAIPSVEAFASPLGAVPLDGDALAQLRELPFVEVDDRAHAQEHCLEVHVPFLQAVLGDFRLVPIVVGDATTEESALLFETLWGGEETLIVVSSDLSHYLPYEAARRRDRATAEAIIGLEARLVPDEACGAIPINGLLRTARLRKLVPRMLDLRNSGDTAGSRDRVVGYGAFAFGAMPQA
jgi:AmmeMemoRadiSam system protein B